MRAATLFRLLAVSAPAVLLFVPMVVIWVCGVGSSLAGQWRAEAWCAARWDELDESLATLARWAL